MSSPLKRVSESECKSEPAVKKSRTEHEVARDLDIYPVTEMVPRDKYRNVQTYGKCATDTVFTHIIAIVGLLSLTDTDLTLLYLFSLTHLGKAIIRSNMKLVTNYCPNLIKIDKFLSVINNPVFTLLDLPKVNRIGDDFEIRENDVLCEINAPRLNIIAGNLDVESNCQLQNLVFEELTSVDKELCISNNGKLAIITFPRIANVGGDLIIVNNESLVVLVGLSQIENHQEDISIQWNPKLAALDCFSRLTHAEGHICIANNLSLTSIRMRALECAGSFDIYNNPQLKDVELYGRTILRDGKLVELESVEGFEVGFDKDGVFQLVQSDMLNLPYNN